MSPSPLFIPAGSTSAQFTATIFKVSATKSVTITAKANGGSKKATLTVTP